MELFRVVPHIPDAEPGEPGHPMYLPTPQGRGRIDNPMVYTAWYFGVSDIAAVGETFGDLAEWNEEMFVHPALGCRRALAVYDLADDTALLDLDNANSLLQLGIRPTQVVTRDRQTTQAWALAAYQQNRWAGVSWWSFHRPHWTVVGLWQPHGEPPTHRLDRVESLDIESPAVVEAATQLSKRRPLRP